MHYIYNLANAKGLGDEYPPEGRQAPPAPVLEVVVHFPDGCFNVGRYHRIIVSLEKNAINFDLIFRVYHLILVFIRDVIHHTIIASKSQ